MELELGELTVLVGENGTGKSTLIEALELLRRASAPGFAEGLRSAHLGLPALLRWGSDKLLLHVFVEGGGPRLRYELSLAQEAGRAVVEYEVLTDLDADGSDHADLIIDRVVGRANVRAAESGESGEVKSHQPSPDVPMIGSFGMVPPHPAIHRMADALSRIDVHVPFDVMARWARPAQGRSSAVREAALASPATTVQRLGSNLANAYQALRNDFGRPHWDETMELVRVGLGYDIEDVVVSTRLAAADGTYALGLKYRGVDPIVSSFAVSDGMLAYLAFVALLRLNPKQQSLIAFDEPETHLHPRLLLRVLQLFEAAGRECPIILSTHSDLLLDGLRDPAGSVVLCELDDERRTVLSRPAPDALGEWLERYRGLGELRAEGYLGEVFPKREAS